MQNLFMTKQGMEQTLKILDGIKTLTSNTEIKAGISEPDIEHLIKYCEDMRRATNTTLKLIAKAEDKAAKTRDKTAKAEDKAAKTRDKTAKAEAKPIAPELKPESDEDFDFLD